MLEAIIVLVAIALIYQLRHKGGPTTSHLSADWLASLGPRLSAVGAGYIVAPIAIIFSIVLFATLFPEVSANYVRWDGPVFYLLAGIALIIVVAAVSMPKWLKVGLIVMIALPLGYDSVRAWYNAIFYPPPCLADDAACHARLAEREAEELRIAIAQAERRAVLEAAKVRALSTSDRCTGEYTALTYNEHEVVNPNYCQVRWWVESGCVQWFDSRGSKLGRPTCTNESRNITGQYALESVGGPAIVSITLCEPSAVGTKLESCS